jgi:hypothetical protein
VTIGSATTDLISVYGVAPVSQAAAITTTLLTTAMVSVTGGAVFGFANDTVASTFATTLISLAAACKAFGITA